MKTQRSIILNTAVRSDLARVMSLAMMMLAFFLIVPSPASAQRLPNMAGNWSGTYTCAQGLTKLRLAIFQTSASSVTAVFKFSADSTNPAVPSGRYWMSGSYHRRSGKIMFRPSRWIKRPTNYLMVGLDGNVESDNSSISGTVLNSACSTFTVSRG
ncbi:MAG: hypothetical protein ABL984_17600 [Pyrinomonadaceae bacterium]